MEVKYSFGSYNKCDEKEQWIRITEGCPNNCSFCYEPTNYKVFGIPEIVRNDVKIIDMNLLCKGDQARHILYELEKKRVNGKVVYYELVCGIDYRVMDQEFANALKQARFRNIRLAWDYSFSKQKKIREVINMLLKAGYNPSELTIFMICNWKTPYVDNCKKLDLCKVWNVKVADCWYDNQTSPNIKPIHWDINHIKKFRGMCRKHNQLVLFGIDPEVK